MRTIIAASLLILLAAVACGEEAPEPTVVPYEFTTDEVTRIDANINRNMQPEYNPLKPEEFSIMCRNYEMAGWDYNRVVEDLEQSKRSRFAHVELILWLWDATSLDHDHRSLAAGYCDHKPSAAGLATALSPGTGVPSHTTKLPDFTTFRNPIHILFPILLVAFLLGGGYYFHRLFEDMRKGRTKRDD